LFNFGELPRPTGEGLGFAGFRIHHPLNRPDYFDEICAFLGASYFRAVARHQGYGLSARGLAIKTADPGGEEFPAFRAFWIERPLPRSRSIVVHALLDSPSAASSFQTRPRACWRPSPSGGGLDEIAPASYPKALIFNVDVTSGTPVLSGEFVVDPGTGVAAQMPSVDMDQSDRLGITWMESSRDEFLSMWVANSTRTPATSSRRLRPAASASSRPISGSAITARPSLTPTA
jgi:hypothetical protein